MIIIGRLYFLQVLKGDYYRALAHGQQKIIREVTAERGRVFFQGGQFLATNKRGKFLYISPREIKDKEETAKIISEIINLPESELLEKIEKDNYFQLLKKRLSKEEIDSLKKLNLKGIYFGKATFRNYPQGTLASQVIGFLNEDGQGQYGLEGYYDQILKGEKKLQKRLTTPWRYLTSLIDSGPKRGLDIWLTLDYPIQFMAEKLLQQAKENFNIESGQIIVIEPQSGRILALANFPNFDPNRHQEYANAKGLDIFQNSAIQKIFEPGSVFKPITLAAALEEGKITPQTTYYDEGKVRLDGWTIYNFERRKWGERTMTEVLEKSINTGTVFAQRQLGNEKFLKYIESFGLFEPSGIDLEGETFFHNRNLKQGRDIKFATVSYGHGIGITPIQLVRAFSVIANGGKLIEPYIVERIVGSEIIEKKGRTIPGIIISPKTISQLTEMMVSTVEQGFGRRARIPGYYVAGKTGTAQIPLRDKRGYYSDKTIQSFIGFAPAFDPKFLILVKLNNPEKRTTAAYSAAPIFRELAKYIIDYWRIPPDYE